MSIRITRVHHSSQLASILQRLERDLPLPDCRLVDRKGVSKRDASSAALTAVTPAWCRPEHPVFKKDHRHT
jgi:hypothetical protein